MNSQRLTLTGFVAGIVFAGLLSWLLSGCAGGAYYANAAPIGYTQRPFIAGGGFGLNNGFVRNGIGADRAPTPAPRSIRRRTPPPTLSTKRSGP